VTLAEAPSPANHDLLETVPEPFRGIVRECLQLDPNRRGSLQEIQERMQPVAAPAHRTRSVPAPLEQAPVADSEGRWSIRIAAALVMVVLGILLAVFHWRSNKPPETTAATSQPATEAAAAPTASALRPAVAPKSAEATPTPRTAVGEVVRQVLPEVSRSAQNTIRGTIKVVVRVLVDPSGKVTSAKFRLRGSSRYFADRAMKAAEQWEFSAPEVNGQPAPSTWLLQFRFNRKSIQAKPERVQG
jgi:TonB family protein